MRSQRGLMQFRKWKRPQAVEMRVSCRSSKTYEAIHQSQLFLLSSSVMNTVADPADWSTLPKEGLCRAIVNASVSSIKSSPSTATVHVEEFDPGAKVTFTIPASKSSERGKKDETSKNVQKDLLLALEASPVTIQLTICGKGYAILCNDSTALYGNWFRQNTPSDDNDANLNNHLCLWNCVGRIGETKDKVTCKSIMVNILLTQHVTERWTMRRWMQMTLAKYLQTRQKEVEN